jgi:hypothetical protein
MNIKISKFFLASILLTILGGTAQAGLITTTFQGGNENEGAMFDLSVFDSDIILTGVDLYFADLGTTTIEVYSRIGTYEGFEGSSVGWTVLSSTFVGSTNSSGTPTFLDLTDFGLLANTTYGMYFYSTNHAVDIEYTNGDNVYTNAVVSIKAGVGINDFHSRVYQSRTWNGTLYYDTTDVPEPSTFAIFAFGMIGLASRRFKKQS